MKSVAVLMMIVLLSLSASAYGQSLIGLRIEGPEQVPADSLTLYRVYAEFDNGWEYEVTLDTALWLDPGVHASIGPFGDFHAFAVDGYAIETIFAYYSFGPDYQIATLDVVIVSADIDQDGDIDLDDFAWLNVCLAGPGETTPPGGCTSDMFDRSDLNGDIYVDASDYAAFQRLFIRVCIDDGDCDDENPCTIDACENGHCVYTEVDCDDGLFCTGEEFCDPGTGDCVSPGNPCPEGMVCNEATDQCQEGGLTFFFTEDIDVPVGTTGDDLFIANDSTYNTGDFADGRAGIDRLDLTTVANEPDLVDLLDIERIFVRNTFNGQAIDLSGYSGIQELWYQDGNEDLTLEFVDELAALGFVGGDPVNSDFTVEFSDALVVGMSDEVTIILDGAHGGDIVARNNGGTDGFETITVNCIGNSELDVIQSPDLSSALFIGSGSLTLRDTLAGADTIDSTGLEGDLDVLCDDEDMTITGGVGNDTFRFGLGEFDDDDSVDCGGGDADVIAIALNDSILQNLTVFGCEIFSVQGDGNGVAADFELELEDVADVQTVRVESLGPVATPDTLLLDNITLNTTLMFRGDGEEADQVFDSIMLDVLGGGTSLEIVFMNRGEGLGSDFTMFVDTIDVDTVETVTVNNNDGGDTTIGTLDGGDITDLTVVSATDFLILTPLESEEVDEVDGSQVQGNLLVDIANSTQNALMIGGTGQNTLSGGAGADTILGGPDEDTLTSDAGDDELTGGAGADTIDGGPGDDMISGGPGDDVITGGAGADALVGGADDDTFRYSDQNDGAGVAVVGAFNGGNADQIEDFDNDDDVVSFANAFLDNDVTSNVASGAVDLNTDGFIFINNATAASLTDEALVIAAIGAVAGDGGAQQAAFAIRNGAATQTGIYAYIDNGAADGAVVASELYLLAIVDEAVTFANLATH